MDNLLVISRCCPFHMNTSAFYACFLGQSIELSLEKDFQLIRCQERQGHSSGLTCRSLDLHRVWVFRLLRFQRHTNLLLASDERRRATWFKILNREYSQDAGLSTHMCTELVGQTFECVIFL